MGDLSLPELIVVAHFVFVRAKMFLVKSCENLLMVDKYLSIGFEHDLGYNDDVEFHEEFELDCWDKGNRILFRKQCFCGFCTDKRRLRQSVHGLVVLWSMDLYWLKWLDLCSIFASNIVWHITSSCWSLK